MSDTITCSECGYTISREELRNENLARTSGKHTLNCPSCSEEMTIEFYCKPCDVWHSGRISLKPYDNGSVSKYVCPDCDGWISRGEVLDVRQGVYR